jgi:hypothetical protein
MTVGGINWPDRRLFSLLRAGAPPFALLGVADADDVAFSLGLWMTRLGDRAPTRVEFEVDPAAGFSIPRGEAAPTLLLELPAEAEVALTMESADGGGVSLFGAPALGDGSALPAFRTPRTPLLALNGFPSR